MTLQAINGRGLIIPETYAWNAAPAFTSSVIDATGEKIAWCGKVFTPDRGSKSITKVGFRFGTVTKAGGSGLTVSLQDLNTATSPTQPDETQDQTVAIANGDANFASNTFYITGAISANRSVTYGENLCVVVEFDGGGRLGADAVNFSNHNWWVSTAILQPVVSLKTGGTWAGVNGHFPNVLLEFSDGTFGTIYGGTPISAINTHTYNSGTAGADEHALEFSLPFPCMVDGAWLVINLGGTSSDFDVIIYDGTTAIASATASIDAHTVSTTGNARHLWVPFTGGITLSANTTYRLAVKPTTANSVTVYSFDVAAAGHFQAHGGGASFAYTTRVDAGSWAAATTTRRLVAGLTAYAFDDGAGGASGGFIIGG